VLFLLLLAYLSLLIYQRDLDEDDVPQGEFVWQDVPKLLIGLLLVILGGQYLVGSAKIVAAAAGLSPYVIGATVVAAATSAPEAVTSIVAIVRGMEQISLGNLIGSNIFNVLGVLGVAGFLSQPPLQILSAAEFGSLVFLCVQMIFTALLLRNGWNLNRREGALLFVVNLISWIVIVWAGRPAV
jgi:cation:H+ antiporter